MPNDREFLHRIIKSCRSFEIEPIIFGGWAEEFRGKPAWVHADIDFLILAEDFLKVDTLFSTDEAWSEILQKRFPHKRAALVDGVMVEFCLVQSKNGRLITNFFNCTTLIWPEPNISTVEQWLDMDVSIITKEALEFYRLQYDQIKMAYQMFLAR